MCGLCGHKMVFERCGYAAAGRLGEYKQLCHDESHDCYHAWTLNRTRPGDPWPHGCGTDPRVGIPDPWGAEPSKLREEQ